jgi:hypothetical protein
MAIERGIDLGFLQAALVAPRYLSPVSAWVEHIPFAFALVDMLRPQQVVELGTHMGDSYCAFCQAVETLGLQASLTAVDTWTGDPQAGGYARNILEGLRAYHDPRYGRFSRLLQSTFDEAAGQFADGSIDLLHIDGLHTYEAVRHDFETWMPKVSTRGVVLFHDTQVRKGDFGVYRLWEELAARHRSFEFTHGYGLGVLAVGRDLPEAVRTFLDHAARSPELVRQYFQVLGNRVQMARGFRRLGEIESARQESLTEMLAPFEAAPPAVPAPAETGDEVDLLDSVGYDLKQWIDWRCEAAAGRSTIVGHLSEHLRWLHGKEQTLSAQNAALGAQISALETRIAALTAKPLPAQLAIYTSDGEGQYSDARLHTAQIVPDGTAVGVRMQISMAAGGAGRKLRIDPGDRAAFWWFGAPRLELAGGSIPVGPACLQQGPGTRLLSPAADLDTPAGRDYVLFSFTGDPQFELRIGGLLPRTPVVFDLVLECRLLDCFHAYRGAPPEAVDARVADLLAAALAEPSGSGGCRK